MGFNSGFKGLNRKDWLTLSCTVTWGLKGLTCTLDGWYYRARQKHRQQSRAPGPFRNARPRYSVPASALSGRHCPWHQQPLNYTSPASFYKHVGDVTMLITPNNIHYISTCIHVLGQWYIYAETKYRSEKCDRVSRLLQPSTLHRTFVIHYITVLQTNRVTSYSRNVVQEPKPKSLIRNLRSIYRMWVTEVISAARKSYR